MSNDILASSGITIARVKDGEQTFTWFKYADDKHGNGLSDSPEGKSYIGLAFNQPTPEGSDNPDDYKWSEMPQNMEIGGRNLVLDSRNGDDGWTSSGYIVAEGQLAEDWEPGKTYTATIKGTPSGSSFSIARDSGTVKQGNFTYDPDRDIWIYIFIAEDTPETDKNTFTLYDEGYTGAGSSIDWIKIERGNVSTDWTRAIEDTEKKIYEVNLQILPEKIVSTVTGSEVYTNDLGELIKKSELASTFEQTYEKILLSAEYIDLKGAVTFSSFGEDVTKKLDDIDSDVGTAQSNANTASSTANAAKKKTDAWTYNGTTKINGANIQTGSLSAGQITTGVLRDSENYTRFDLTNGTFNIGDKFVYNGSTLSIKADSINLSGKVTFDDFSPSLKSTVNGKATQSDINTSISNIEVGGRNSLLNTRTERGFSNTVHEYSFSDEVDNLLGQTVTLSLEARTSNGTDRFDFYPWSLNGWVPVHQFQPTREFKKYTHTFTFRNDANISTFRFRNNRTVYSGNNGILYIKNVKLEKGNKGTGWSPAPEDVYDDLKSSGKVTIHGGNITANTITASRITGRLPGSKLTLDGNVNITESLTVPGANIGNITANKITSGTMSGDRIEAGTLSADRIDTKDLSSISANLGTVTAGMLMSENYKTIMNLNLGFITTQDIDRGTMVRLSDGVIEQRTDTDTYAADTYHGFKVDEKGLGLYMDASKYPSSNMDEWKYRKYITMHADALKFSPGVLDFSDNDIVGAKTFSSKAVQTKNMWANKLYVGENSTDVEEAINNLSGNLQGIHSSNGWYIMFEDGTAIEWVSNLGLLYRDTNRLDITWNFTTLFKSPPTVLATSREEPSIEKIRTASIGTASYSAAAVISLFSASGQSFVSGDSSAVSAIAIGRWR